jgi:hypothetical protein
MALNSTPCQVNSATSIADPGTVVNGAGVSITRNIYIVAASATFTANGVACKPGAQDGAAGYGSTTFNPPFLVTGAVSSATIGTIWYYVQ